MVVSEDQIQKHTEEWFPAEKLRQLRSRFHRDGFVKIPEIVPDDLHSSVHAEIRGLLDGNAERRDLRLATTGNTKRAMSVVRSETIAAASVIPELYRSPGLTSTLGAIAGERLHPCPSKDEEFLITRQERAADTHGWHWGDFSFALIWIAVAPPVSHGGMLQCVPHTEWNKSDPRIHEYLCENPIRTYGFVTGDIYFLRTDTTLHRTVPLVQDSTRVILNMTWASAKDLADGPAGDDRWWEDSAVEAAQPSTTC